MEFRRSKEAGASAYRVQVAEDEAFSRSVVDRSGLSGSSWKPDQALAPGSHHWRVASLTSAGKQGPFGDAAQLRVAPYGAVMGAADVDEGQLTMRWSGARPGQRYRFQLSSDTAFTQRLVDQEMDEPQITIPRPEPGLYHARASVIEADGYEGPFGAPRSIDVPGKFPWPVWLLPFIVLL